MSDKEKFISLMQEFGIPLTHRKDINTLFIEVDTLDDPVTTNVDGYSGFWCSYEFTPEGKFVKMFIGE